LAWNRFRVQCLDPVEENSPSEDGEKKFSRFQNITSSPLSDWYPVCSCALAIKAAVQQMKQYSRILVFMARAKMPLANGKKQKKRKSFGRIGNNNSFDCIFAL